MHRHLSHFRQNRLGPRDDFCLLSCSLCRTGSIALAPVTEKYAMGQLPAARVSVTLLGQSVVTTILGILFLKEALSPTDITGGLMVLIGIYLVNQRTQSKAGDDAYAKSA